MLLTRYFLETLKKGTSYLIPKLGKDITNPSNYRSITLLESIAKSFEKIMNTRLRTHLEETNQLNEQQYGFRTKNILDVIFYSIAYIDNLYNNKKSKTAITCLDIENAFDKVWCNGLVYKIFNKFDLPNITKKAFI